uniref:Transposase n=1 Tax=Ditylenchus dipsaci TaxID=166011 RepID=A0A915D966_9BILA
MSLAIFVAISSQEIADTFYIMVNNSLFKNAEIKLLLESCRKLVGHFNHSFLAKDRLKKEQISAMLPLYSLLQDEPTRWNSSFYMGQRLLEQGNAIEIYMVRYKRRDLEKKPEE